jgi:hypothetical protein
MYINECNTSEGREQYTKSEQATKQSNEYQGDTMIYPWFGCLPVLAVLNDQV